MWVSSCGVKPQTNIETRLPWSGAKGSFFRVRLLYTRIDMARCASGKPRIKVRDFAAGTPPFVNPRRFGAEPLSSARRHPRSGHGGLVPPPACLAHGRMASRVAARFPPAGHRRRALLDIVRGRPLDRRRAIPRPDVRRPHPRLGRGGRPRVAETGPLDRVATPPLP